MKRMIQRMLAAILVICGATVLTSCSNDDDPAGQQDEYSGVPLIIYDTDIGSSADDLFALEMLYRYEDEGRCRYQLPGSEAWAAQMLEKIRRANVKNTR